MTRAYRAPRYYNWAMRLARGDGMCEVRNVDRSALVAANAFAKRHGLRAAVEIKGTTLRMTILPALETKRRAT